MAAPVITEALDYLTQQPSKTTQPAFDCRIRQRDAKWHWQVVNAYQVSPMVAPRATLRLGTRSFCDACNA
jgi:hypothetical protein